MAIPKLRGDADVTDPAPNQIPTDLNKPNTDVAYLLSEEGPFAAQVAEFRTRDEQVQLAQAVSQALADGQDLVAEAGTGVGKTFAYLTPIVLAGVKAIISTGTKTLQGQLFHRDLPVVLSALGIRRKIALLKGRANYLCRYRLKRRLALAFRKGQDDARSLMEIDRWSESDPVGELVDIPVTWSHQLAPEITSTAENCLGKECPNAEDCFVFRARGKAMAADIVVVNHHLLFADLGLKSSGFGEILPHAEAIVIDEAHKAPDIATEFFGLSVSTRMLRDLMRDTMTEANNEPGMLPTVRPACEELDAALKRVRLMFGTQNRRAGWDDGIAARVNLSQLSEPLLDLIGALEHLAPVAPGLESCYVRALDHNDRLAQFERGAADHVCWFETSNVGFTLHLTPLEIAGAMRDTREMVGMTWIYTSATLSAAGSFDLFKRRFGLDNPATLIVDSPFDYENQARLFLPNLPEPASPNHIDALLETIEPLLEVNRGRAFLLFTSHRNLQLAASLLRQQQRWQLFVQGEAPRERLLEGFLATDHAVLLGAASFWEGVDVAGAALSLVVIDKLPFAAPGDPILASRTEKLRSEGLDPFNHEQLPHAILTLKQGAGRLIRGESDHGVLVIGDCRIRQKAYGRRFLASLPPMRHEHELQPVLAFMEERNPQ